MMDKIDIDRFPILTESDRIEAEQIARENLLERDPEPARDHFAQHTISKYSPAFMRGVFIFVIMMFAAGFGPSAFRIFYVANSTFSATGSFSADQAKVVGVSFVLLAEIAVVLFSMAAGVLDVRRDMKRLLYTAACASALLAIIGNVQVAVDYDSTNPFDWAISLVRTIAFEPFAGFEAILPPLFTLLGGTLLKELVLADNERRHSNEHAYQTALDEWQERVKNLEEHPSWISQKANAIRQIYQRVHGRKQVIKDGVTDHEWRAIVAREMRLENWFDADDLDAQARPLSGAASSMGFAASLHESGESMHGRTSRQNR